VAWLEVLTSCRSRYSINLHRKEPPSSRIYSYNYLLAVRPHIHHHPLMSKSPSFFQTALCDLLVECMSFRKFVGKFIVRISVGSYSPSRPTRNCGFSIVESSDAIGGMVITDVLYLKFMSVCYQSRCWEPRSNNLTDYHIYNQDICFSFILPSYQPGCCYVAAYSFLHEAIYVHCYYFCSQSYVPEFINNLFYQDWSYVTYRLVE